MLLHALYRQNEHQYAFDANGKWVNAIKTDYNEHQSFSCSCPELHKMKLVKPSGALGKRSFTDYFAHITNKMQKTIEPPDMMIMSCRGGGESIIHSNAKHRLRECVGAYCFATSSCPGCNTKVLQYTHNCTVSMEVVSDDKRWRYDCLLQSKEEGRALVAMEVFHTHSSGPDKIQSVRESGLEIVEFRAKEVLYKLKASTLPQGPLIQLENIKVNILQCQLCTSDLRLKQLKSDEKVMNMAIVDEIKEIIRLENYIDQGYIRQDILNQVLSISDNEHEKCKALISMSLDRLEIFVHHMNENIGFSKISRKINHGLIISDFDNDLPTKEICIFLLSDWDIENIHTLQWKQPNLDRSFHIFLHCSTVLKKLNCLEGSEITLKDCRWAILKRLEETHGICANCGKKGHTSDDCHSKFCFKCGRYGHLKGRCFARKDVLNQIL